MLRRQGMKGLTAPAIKNKIALRASLTGSIFMDTVRVGQDSLLPGTKGLGSAFECLNSARSVFPPSLSLLPNLTAVLVADTESPGA